MAFVESRHPQVRASGLLAEGHPAWVLREQAQNATQVVLGSWHLSAVQELFTSAAVALPLIAHAPRPAPPRGGRTRAGARHPAAAVLRRMGKARGSRRSTRAPARDRSTLRGQAAA